MIDGMRLTISGETLCRLLRERAEHHRAAASRWRADQTCTSSEDDEGAAMMPEHMLEHAIARHEWRADVLDFLRAHIDASDVYRLAEPDLAFAELLPEMPPSIALEEYEERTRLAFDIDRLATAIRQLARDPFERRMQESSGDLSPPPPTG